MEEKIEPVLHAQTKPKNNVSEIIREGNIPTYYANGFTIGYSATDVHIIGIEHGNNRFVIETTLPVAKSMLGALAKLIDTYETKTNIKIPTLEELKIAIMPKK